MRGARDACRDRPILQTSCKAKFLPQDKTRSTTTCLDEQTHMQCALANFRRTFLVRRNEREGVNIYLKRFHGWPDMGILESVTALGLLVK